MRLITYNIQYGRGRDGQFDIGRIVDAIRDADIIALQEVEAFWNRSGNIDQVEEISRRLPAFYYAWGPTVDILKSNRDEDGKVCNRRRQFGNMILSRFPIASMRNHLYPKFTARVPHSIQRGAIEATIESPGGAIRVYSTHLCHLSGEKRLLEIGQLIKISNDAMAEGPVEAGTHRLPGWMERALPTVPRDAIICGDMNFTPDAAEYGLLAGPLHTTYGRVPGINDFADAWTQAGNDENAGPTFCKETLPGPGRRIDYCFVNGGLAARVSKAEVDTVSVGSDHQPLRVEFTDR
jgi:endonuclease/exonuclease/phosphatase family metal-dependent hydrolase